MLVIDVAAVVLASVRQLFAYPPQEHYNISHKKFFGNSKFYDIQVCWTFMLVIHDIESDQRLGT